MSTILSAAEQDMHSWYTEAIVSRHVRELFRLLPRLSGFRVGADLTVVEVSVSSSPEYPKPRGLYRYVMQSIVELTECHPEAVRLMGGRAFARSVPSARWLSDDIATVC